MSPQCQQNRIERDHPVIALTTEPRPSKSALNEALAMRTSALVAAIPAAVVVINGSGEVIFCNIAAERLLDDRLVGAAWSTLIIRLFEPTLVDAETLRLKSGRAVTLETSPLGYAPGQLLLLRDVTEQLQFTQRLQQQQRLTDMGRMAASLAHQIRTPLSTALLYASQLRNESADPLQGRRFAEKVVASLRSLEQLIHNILLFSRGESGEERPLSPSRLLTEVAATMKAQLEQAGIHLRQGGEAAAAITILGNRSLLLSALQNLLGNAINALPAGGEIILSTRVAETGSVDLQVCDNGPGIDTAQQATLFDPFVSHRAKGTGLGLAVVRAVARAHRGEVWVDSIPGEGACFTLRIPTVSTDTQPMMAGR